MSTATAPVLDSVDKATNMSADELAREASTLRDRINRFRLALGRFFVAKQPLIDLMRKVAAEAPRLALAS